MNRRSFVMCGMAAVLSRVIGSSNSDSGVESLIVSDEPIDETIPKDSMVVGICFSYPPGYKEWTRKWFGQWVDSKINDAYCRSEQTIFHARGLTDEQKADGNYSAVAIYLPCGGNVAYHSATDIPMTDVPCPCGSPRHWMIKYQEMDDLNS